MPAKPGRRVQAQVTKVSVNDADLGQSVCLSTAFADVASDGVVIFDNGDVGLDRDHQLREQRGEETGTDYVQVEIGL